MIMVLLLKNNLLKQLKTYQNIKTDTMGYYKFTFKDENGHSAGWNDVQANNKEEAYKLAVETYNHEGYDFNYEVYTDATCTTTATRVGRNKGMFVDKDSLVEMTFEQRNRMHRIADMMAR